MRKLCAILACIAALVVSTGPGSAASDTFSTRQTRVLVPFSPGGGLDLVARLMATRLSIMWGQQVIVENKPGAGGIIASREVAAAKPDGHLLLVVAGGHALNPLIYDKLPYDTLTAFTPLSILVSSGNVLLVPKNSPLKTVADVIAEAKKTPGGLAYGTAGVGTSVHLSGELFSREAHVPMLPIHFKGDSDSLTALMGEQIPASFNSLIGALPAIKQGTVRAIAVTSLQRSESLPDVPTIAESGVAGFDVLNWWGILGPAKMSPDVVAKLNADIRTALEDPQSVERLKAIGVKLEVSNPQAFADLIKSEMERWTPVVKAAGIKVQ
jgi:tripartite-type tricarboxylate transporter receptor subunit TctC